MSKGYIYIVSNKVGGIKGTDYVKEAIFSAKSLRKNNPNANICLFTNENIKNDVFSEIKIVDMSLRCKQYYLDKSPYEKTIYIDSDTYIDHNIEDMFLMLDKYDIIGCHDYARKRNFSIPEYMNIPYAFSEINGGIIGYKKNKNFNKFLNLWKQYYEKYKSITIYDQPSFRIALWESNINLYILPIEYNRRSIDQYNKSFIYKKNNPKSTKYPNDHLKTRIFHFHGLENMDKNKIEQKAQHL